MAHLKSVALACLIFLCAPMAQAAEQACVNDRPNPYTFLGRWGEMPEGRVWGGTAGVALAPNGNIWAIDRCGAAGNCAGSDLAPILEYTPEGKLVRAIGAGLFVFPHGLTIDRHGDVWVTDSQAKDGKGMQAVKLSLSGEMLLRLGVAGMIEGEGALDQPTSVAVARNGDIYVAEGHNPNYVRSQVVRYSKSGKRLGVISTKGNEPGQIYGPHSLAFDSRGRLFVADRNNNRVSIFDANGKFLEAWKQFGRPSGIYIDRNDRIYVADSESNDRDGAYGFNPSCKNGIRIGSARTGKIDYFIPSEPPVQAQGNPAPEGVTIDRHGAVYGAINGAKGLRKYVLNK